MTQKSYKFRLYPNKTQQGLLRQFFGAKRFVWNACLSWRTGWYQAYGESVNGIDYSRIVTRLKKHTHYAWLKAVPASILQQGLRDQDKAFQRFFKEGAGYPKFKSRHHQQSIRFTLDQRTIMNNYRAGTLLKLTGLGAIKVNWSRLPAGIPKMATVSQDAAGRYFVSMSIEEDIQPLPSVGKTVGIDLGTLTAMTLSDGEQIENPRHLLKRKSQLKKLQQRLARQQKGSNRRARTQLRIGKLHAKITDCRREYCHQVTTKIINENQVIVLEDLNVKGMTASSKGDRESPGKRVKQKSGLNRSLLDVSFGEITRQLEYKAAWYGRTVLKVDRFFPSSKTCSACGHKLDELKLDIREWICPKCQTVHDRDINAAINIESEGLKQLAPVGMKGPQLRDSGSEGVYSMTVSPRNTDQPSACQEQV